MVNTDEIIDILRSTLNELEGFGVKRIGLFGSYARGEEQKDSDIDILIEFKEGMETFDNLLNVHELLKSKYQREIDLVTVGGLSPYIGPHIMEEVIFIEEAST